jgi:maltose alpha-D-glucosyltransferase/alpha-amylase
VCLTAIERHLKLPEAASYGRRMRPWPTTCCDSLYWKKAVYEVGYELANRPDWVHVPLSGLWRTLFPVESA